MSLLSIDLRMYRHSGIGRYLRNVVPELLPLLRAGRIRIITNPGLLGDAGWLSDPRIEPFETPATIYSPQEQMLALGPAYRGSTLLWVPHYNAPLLYRGPLALTVHDIAPLALPEILPNPLKRAYAHLLIRRSVARASAILCDSAFTQSELVHLLRADPRKLSVVHLGLDDWPTDAPAHVEDDGVPYLLFVGNVKPNKNLQTLLSAFEQVLDRIPHRLLLAGRMRGFETGDEAVIRQAERLAPRVRFTGEISDADLISLYAGASALVLPSLYEGFGLPVLEAMALGCPVFCSTAGSLPETAGPDGALFFDPRDPAALASLLPAVLDSARMHQLRAAGAARVRAFSYRRCAEQTAAVLNRFF